MKLIRTKKFKRSKKGFTLLELVVVMFIIAILVGLSAPKFIGKVQNAKVTVFKNDVETLQNIAQQDDLDRQLENSTITTPFGSGASIAIDKVDKDLVNAIKSNAEVKSAYDKDKNGTIEDTELSGLGLATLNPDNFTSKMANNLKDKDLTKYIIITEGDLKGTILYNNPSTNVLDENNVRYFGLHIHN